MSTGWNVFRAGNDGTPLDLTTKAVANVENTSPRILAEPDNRF